MSILSTPGQASACGNEHPLPAANGIGDLFRDWGETYIEKFKPDLRQIKLIRAIRVCRTSVLGGQRYECLDCNKHHYRYFSCGHSHCPICQGVKRMQWQDRLRSRMLPVPYAHLTFTVPHELNGLMRRNGAVLYNILFQAAWRTIKAVCADADNVGGLPGMTAVLHTWGADLKYHVHLHCLVTFGGYERENKRWCWPRRKFKLCRFRELRGKYRAIFLKLLAQAMSTENSEIVYHESYTSLCQRLENKTWVVNHQRPTAETEVIEQYLGRYICRIGITNKRLSYDGDSGGITLEYNDYARQLRGRPAPKAYRHLHPLDAMQQLLQHVLPAYFHRSRHYGLHAANTYHSVKDQLPERVRGEGETVRTIVQILQALLQSEPYRCPYCDGDRLEKTEVSAECAVTLPYWLNDRAPPLKPTRETPDFSDPEEA